MMVPPSLIWMPLAAVTAVAMDLWSALLHGRVWHRWLWSVHRSHHAPRRGRFESNDALSALHAPLAIALVLYGCAGPAGAAREVAFGIGLGMSAFGLAYVLVHDGLVHRRLPVGWLAGVPYLRRVASAHRVHHAGARGGPPFGLFFGPLEIARHRRHATEPPRANGRRRPPSDPPPTARGHA